MKSTLITSLLLAGILVVSGAAFVQADQRARNPGGDSGGGSSGGSSSGGSGTSTGSAVSRGGGSTPWGGGSVSSRPSEPSSSNSSAGRRPTRVSGGGGSTGDTNVTGYSRPRNGAPVTGYAVPRGSVATLPPIISGPIYWGPGDWYFYPWGYGGMAFAYFWDPWMWSGYYGSMGGYGGYPWVDPYWGGGGGSYGGWDSGGGGQSSASSQSGNPLDANGPTGALRLKVEPRDAEVYVDGFFAGHVDDFDGAMQKLKVVAGPHRIELKAPGYETTTFEVNVVADQTTSYKTELKRH